MRFKKIYIEILNSCNLKCPFCIQNSRHPEMLSISKFEKIVNEIKPFTSYIYLHVLGEPLMHPNLKEFLDIAYANDLQVNLTTNGTLLTQQIDNLLNSKALRQINISLHSFPKQKNYLSNVLACAKRLSKSGKYVSLRLWTFDELNISIEMKETLEIIKTIFPIQFDRYKGSYRLDDHLYLSFDETFEWPKTSLPFVSTQGKCQGWINQCGILVDGTVIPCCLDAKGVESLGNIYEDSFSDIVEKNQKLLDRMRQHHLDLELCQHCSYRTRFDK